MRGDQKKYEDFVQQINPYVPAIKKILKDTDKNYEFNISSQRFGLLDTSKLAEAYQGVNTVYLRKGQVKTNKTTLVVLIDASGSMSGRKMLMAKKAGILLNEAFKGLNGVDLYIYSHTADMVERGSTEIKIFREAGKLCDPYALSNLEALDENRDGTAILQTVKRVKKISHAEKILMFVISDGEPCASYFYGSSAIESTRKDVIKATSLGATIIQVTIDTVNRAREMFDYCIDLKNNLSDLPKELGKVIKSAVLKDRKTTII
jgi:nitric oxide reductase activation protein